MFRHILPYVHSSDPVTGDVLLTMTLQNHTAFLSPHPSDPRVPADRWTPRPRRRGGV